MTGFKLVLRTHMALSGSIREGCACQAVSHRQTAACCRRAGSVAVCEGAMSCADMRLQPALASRGGLGLSQSASVWSSCRKSKGLVTKMRCRQFLK